MRPGDGCPALRVPVCLIRPGWSTGAIRRCTGAPADARRRAGTLANAGPIHVLGDARLSLASPTSWAVYDSRLRAFDGHKSSAIALDRPPAIRTSRDAPSAIHQPAVGR